MPFKFLVILVLILILISLGKALVHLSGRSPEDGAKMVKALAWRVGLSVGLFLLLILAYFEGWIHPPHG
jgi:Protein of unknown function (DUF2909)